MKHSEYSAVIIGSGAAGLYSALKLSQEINMPDGVLIITKDDLGESNSNYAQGGIVGVLHQNPSDSCESHINDTLRSGAGLNDIDAVKYISKISDEVINDLINNGIEFDRNDDNSLMFTMEAAHSVRRILHAGGDATGKYIIDGLKRAVLKNENINILEHSIAVNLLINKDNECKGVIIYNDLTQEHEIIYTPALILATGGVGQIYKYTTNPKGATGDGLFLAYNAGAEIQDMEFIQFHPTALAISPNSNDRFLISEAVRGEGAKLIDKNGAEFMASYHDKRELAPRDIVTRAIYSQMDKTSANNVFLNTSILDSMKLLSRFPTISKKCEENGIDITKDAIPVAPAAHYTMGGIKASVEGKTSIRGLYAIGECACTGFHGANRLASNSLLECVAMAYELVDYLSFANLETPKILDKEIMNIIDLYSKSLDDTEYNITSLKQNLKDIMWNKVGIIRNKVGLLEAQKEITHLKSQFKRNYKCLNRDEYEYRNMLCAAEIIIKCALAREESRGAHCRSDFKQTNTEAIHSIITKETEKELIYA